MRESLKRARVSQVFLARELGLTRSGVTRRIAGEVEFSASQLAAIAELASVSVDALLFIDMDGAA